MERDGWIDIDSDHNARELVVSPVVEVEIKPCVTKQSVATMTDVSQCKSPTCRDILDAGLERLMSMFCDR